MLAFDIETGPLPEDVLRSLYAEPTFEEFSASCDQRWKPETREAKFEEQKTTGWQNFVDRAALDSSTGKVLAIGFLAADKGNKVVIDDDADEGRLVNRFWLQYVRCRQTNRRMIGANIHGFDLPFLIRRSWILDVPVPATVFDGRYFDRLFIDIRTAWLCGQRWGECPSSLNHIAKSLGVGAKNGDGAQFADLLKTDREAALAYLRNDLELTANCARRMGIAA